MIAIEQQLDIPKPHFDYFVACNSIGYKSFYLLKDKILKVFGHENDYDIQHLKKKCYSCNGTGFYHQNIRCYKCNNGVYEEYDVILQRYILNNSCFHIPLGRLEGNRLKIWDGYYNNDEWGYPEISKWRYELFHGIIKNSINGLIKHDPPKKLNPQFGYWFLLFHYDKPTFNNQTTTWLNTTDKKEYQIRNYLWLTSDHALTALAKYYKCEQEYRATSG